MVRWPSITSEGKKGPRIIDCYTTFGRRPKGGQPFKPQDLVERLRAYGVENCVGLSLRGAFYDSQEGNVETLEASDRFPFIIPAATLDPRRFYGRLEGQPGLNKFSIMRVFPDLQGWPFDFAPFEKILERLSCLGLPLMAPAQGQGDSTRLVRATSKYDLAVIITSVNYSTLSEILALLSDHEGLHICVDMLNTPDGIELITDEFGPERLIFGSNFPTTYFQGPLLAIQKAQISRRSKRMILRENAVRLMGIR